MNESNRCSLHWVNGQAFFSEIKPRIIEPHPICCLAEESYADIYEESKRRMETQNALYWQVGKYFCEKYSGENNADMDSR